MAEVCLYTGRRESLKPGNKRVFGRIDAGGTGEPAYNVSRQQFELECQLDGVTVTSLSAKNPTKVALASGGSVLLQSGQTHVLAPGDRVLLLACDPSMFARLLSNPPPAGSGAETSHQEADAADGRDGAHNSHAATHEPPGKQRCLAPGAEVPQSREPAGGRHEQDRQQEQKQETQAACLPLVVLVLVGVQGAGKSTWCRGLIDRTQQQVGGATIAATQLDGQRQPQAEQPGAQPRSRWVRINQDSIADGRPGSREQCLQAATAALCRGHSVLIDRTNIDQDQRRTWVRLAQRCGAQAHCVMLKLAMKLCQARAAGRSDHEGGLGGQAAYPAVARMHRTLQDMGDPQLGEGFTSILVCESDAEAAAALDAWALRGPQHPDPAAEYARLKPPPPKQPKLNTLDRFFKKLPAQETAAGVDGEPKLAHKAQPAIVCGGKGAALKPQPAPQGAGHTHPQQQQQQSPEPLHGHPSIGPSAQPLSGGGNNALQTLMSTDRQQHEGATSPAVAAPKASEAGSGWNGGSGEQRKYQHSYATGGFARSLVQIAARPESRRQEQPDLWYDDRCVLIPDKFPKAQQHWLVIARDRRLGGPLDLTGGDAGLLQHMMAVAQRKLEQLQASDVSLRFCIGFHAAPSLRQLHLHLISQDFGSPWLKNRKHWISFTSPHFFLHAAWVLSQLAAGHGLSYSPAEKESLLKGELRCHRCNAVQASMPRLKEHIAACCDPLQQQYLF